MPDCPCPPCQPPCPPPPGPPIGVALLTAGTTDIQVQGALGCPTGGGTFTLQLPLLENTAIGQAVAIYDTDSNAAVNNIEILAGGADEILTGGTAAGILTINQNGAAVYVVATAGGWRVFDLVGGVIAGGGGLQTVQDVGAANTYAVNLSPAPVALTLGVAFIMHAANTNTGASTATVDGFTAPILENGAALTAGTIVAGSLYLLDFDGSNFELLTLPSAGGFVTQAELALYAPLTSPGLLGVPTAPTAPPGADSAQLATTAFVMAALGGGEIVSGPGAITFPGGFATAVAGTVACKGTFRFGPWLAKWAVVQFEDYNAQTPVAWTFDTPFPSAAFLPFAAMNLASWAGQGANANRGQLSINGLSGSGASGVLRDTAATSTLGAWLVIVIGN